MKSLTLITVSIAALSLAGCGLRGDLERPDPLWGEPNANDPAPADLDDGEPEQETSELRPRQEPERLAGTSYRDPETGRTIWVQNEGGGVKPLPSPVKKLEEGELPPPAPLVE